MNNEENESAEIRETREALARIQANASAAAPSPGSPPPVQPTSDEPSRDRPSGSGGTPPRDPSRGGGDGLPGGGGFRWNRLLGGVLAIAALVGSLCMIYLIMYRTSGRGTEIQLQEQKTEQLAEVRKTEEAKADQKRAIIIIPPNGAVAPAPTSPQVSAVPSTSVQNRNLPQNCRPVSDRGSILVAGSGECFNFQLRGKALGYGFMLFHAPPRAIVGEQYKVIFVRNVNMMGSSVNPFCEQPGSIVDCAEWLRLLYEQEKASGNQTMFNLEGNLTMYF